MIFLCYVLEVFEQERKSSNLIYFIWGREQPIPNDFSNAYTFVFVFS